MIDIKQGIIYLTFDDGPNMGTTDKILDILKYEDVKATFFVTGLGMNSLIERMFEEGHTIGLHTFSHIYSYIYSSVDNYFHDLGMIQEKVKRITGIDSRIIRFPGGSSNTVSRKYKIGIMSELVKMVIDRGYHYFDWNIDSGDAGGAMNSYEVYNNVINNLSKDRVNVVLMHDTKEITVWALKKIIEYGKENGYIFKKIDMDTEMVVHNVYN